MDSVAVFGSSHPAIIIIRYLVEFGLTRIVNFYLTPLKFALPMEDLGLVLPHNIFAYKPYGNLF